MHSLDIFVQTYISEIRTPGLTEFFYIFTSLFDTVSLVFIVCATGLLVYLVRGKRYALLLYGTMIVAAFLMFGLKGFIGIERPTGGVMNVFGKSFPSGHALLSTTFFTLLIFIFDDYLRGFSRWIFNTLAIVFIFLICVSRIYLGVHWVSDVIGGILLGSVLVYLSTEIFRGITKE